MALKIFLVSLFFMIFPMMAIPYYQFKIPPIYQLLLIILSFIIFLNIILKKRIKKKYFNLLNILVIFDIFLFLIQSEISQIISINTYIFILITLRYYMSKRIYQNQLVIHKTLFKIYFILISYSILQIIFYEFKGVMYLVDYSSYLTSGLNSYILNSPVSGWNKSFRPNAFFSEPSFLGFFILLYTIYHYEINKKMLFLFFNILLLHWFGARSSEIILIVMTLYIISEKFFKKKYLFSFFLFSLIFIFSMLIFNIELINSMINKNTMDFSTYERTYLLMKSIEVFNQNLLVGVGLGNLKDFFILHHLYERDISNVGNLYFQLLSEVGLIGIVFLIFIFKKIYSYSLIIVTLLLTFFFVGSYNLLFMWILPLLIIIYKEENYENIISK